jgi:hypothetical protein
MRCISVVRSLYFTVFSASFFITFLSPEIAISISVPVRSSLSRIMMYGLFFGMVLSVYTFYYYYYYYYYYYLRVLTCLCEDIFSGRRWKHFPTPRIYHHEDPTLYSYPVTQHLVIYRPITNRINNVFYSTAPTLWAKRMRETVLRKALMAVWFNCVWDLSISVALNSIKFDRKFEVPSPNQTNKCTILLVRIRYIFK